MIKRCIVAGLLLLTPLPAHAWMNSSGNPATGSAGLDNWSATGRGGWGYDTFNPADQNVYNRTTSITVGGKTYGIQVEGSFNTTGTKNDRLAISWGAIGNRTAQGFLGGLATGATVSSDPRAIGSAGLLGGLIGAFMGYWDQLQNSRNGTNNTGTNVSNTNCPCSSGGGGDTGGH